MSLRAERFLLYVVWSAAMPFVSQAQLGRAVSPLQEKTKVVVLGVNHSTQLVAESYQPAVFRAFFDKLKPDAICVERSPQEFARNSFYEFTYEQQYLAVPYARDRRIPLCPIDWLPASEDATLAFGLPDLEEPPLVRKPSGFQGFTLFTDPHDLETSLFYADSESDRKKGREFSDVTPEQKTHDFPRRLFLYRTFMQAMRIRAAVNTYPGRTILVLVGSMHKDDIERILGGYADIELVQPSVFGQPSVEEIAKDLEDSDMYAVASFNLLGLQAKSGSVNWDWIGRVVAMLQARSPSTETRLFRTRLEVLTKRITSEAAIRQYEDIVRETAPETRFHFTGVRDRKRIDSYFDPFGNLGVRQRALVELARESAKAGHDREAQRTRDDLLRDPGLSPFQRAQANAYWEDYVLRTF